MPVNPNLPVVESDAEAKFRDSKEVAKRATPTFAPAPEVDSYFDGATPQVLAAVGDWVAGTQVKMLLGASHMIVVSELNEDIIDHVLRQLYAEARLEAHTIQLA